MDFSGLIAVIVVFAAIGGLVGIGFLLWYLWAMARLFPRIGLPAAHGWIPLWNDWRLMERTGLPGWIAILYVVPVGNVVAVVFRTIAQHRIGREAGVGAGYTVLGLLIAPLWATLMGSRLEGRVLAAPGGVGGASHGAAGYAPSQAQGFPSAPGAAPVAAFGAAPQAAAPAPPMPVAPPPTPPAGASASAPLAPAAPDPWASPAWASAPVVDARPADAAAAPLGNETEAEYARLAAESFQAPPAAPLGPPPPPEPFSWTAASQSQPEPEPVREVPPPPVHPVAGPPAPPAPPAPAAPPAPPAPAAPPAPPAPPSPAPVPAQGGSEPLRLPPAPGDETGTGSATDSGSGTGQQVEAAPPRAAVHRSTGITARYEPIVEEDELDRTVVVPRPSRARWLVELPDGETLEIEHDTVLGRRPDAIEGAQVVAIPDPTRTLSKTHARLRFDGERWTIEDLDSTNGVFLIHADGREEELAAGDPAEVDSRIMLGTLEIRLRRSDETA